MLNSALKKSWGFSMMELLVVMSIIIIIAGFALFFSFDSYRGSSFRSERDTVVTVLQKARSQAMSNLCLGSSCTDGLPHGVHYDSGTHCAGGSACYIIFQGSSINYGDATNQQVPVNNNVAIVASSDIVFNQLDASSSGGTITLTDSSGHSSVISINTEGRITWTN